VIDINVNCNKDQILIAAIL